MKIFRDDNRYKEIEKIQEYELTKYITFEMAIRNKIIQKSILEYLAIQNLENYKFNDIFFSEKISVDAFNSYYKIKNKKEFVVKIHEIMLEHKFFISTQTILNFTPEITDFIYNSINIKQDIDDDPFEYETEDYMNITDEKYNEIKSPFPKRNEYDKLSDHLKLVDRKGDTTYLAYVHFNHTNIFHVDESNYSVNNISQSFSKPILTIPLNMQKNVNLNNLNFNLPKKEFMRYIESIYDYYQEVPLNSALTGVESDDLIDPVSYLFWAENTFYIANKIKISNQYKINLYDENFDLEEYHKKNISINTTSGFESENLKEKINTVKTAEDWADCFFIYDYIEFSNTYSSMNDKIEHIMESLELYHEKPSLKRNAIRDRFYMMSYYIKACNYKKLLTG